MSHEKIPPKRLRAWMIAAVSAPIASLAGGSSWLPVLLAAAACGIISFVVQRYCGDACPKKRIAAVVQWLWLGIFLGIMAKYSANCWLDGKAYPTVPLVLIVLSCIAAGKNGQRAAKTGAVLLWFVVILLGAVLAAGVGELKSQWMITTTPEFNPTLIALFLLPCLSVFMPAERKEAAVSTAVFTGAIGVISSFWLQASLSPRIAAMLQNALYEYSKSISLFGTVERFESLLSCALTAGWFCMFSLILNAAGHIAEAGKIGWHKSGVWTSGAVAAVVVLLGWEPHGWVSAAVSMVLWGVIPMLIRAAEKKSKKSENRG